MNVFILTNHNAITEDDFTKTLGVYRTAKRAIEVARADEPVREQAGEVPSYAIHEWSFPDTYAPPEQQPDGVLVATYHARSARGDWTRTTRDAQGVWEIKPYTTA